MTHRLKGGRKTNTQLIWKYSSTDQSVNIRQTIFAQRRLRFSEAAIGVVTSKGTFRARSFAQRRVVRVSGKQPFVQWLPNELKESGHFGNGLHVFVISV